MTGALYQLVLPSGRSTTEEWLGAYRVLSHVGLSAYSGKSEEEVGELVASALGVPVGAEVVVFGVRVSRVG